MHGFGDSHSYRASSRGENGRSWFHGSFPQEGVCPQALHPQALSPGPAPFADFNPYTSAYWTSGKVSYDHALLTHRVKTMFGFDELAEAIDDERKASLRQTAIHDVVQNGSRHASGMRCRLCLTGPQIVSVPWASQF